MYGEDDDIRFAAMKLMPRPEGIDFNTVGLSQKLLEGLEYHGKTRADLDELTKKNMFIDFADGEYSFELEEDQEDRKREELEVFGYKDGILDVDVVEIFTNADGELFVGIDVWVSNQLNRKRKEEIVAKIASLSVEIDGGTLEEAIECYGKFWDEAEASYVGKMLPMKYCFRCGMLMVAGSMAYYEGYHFDTCL